MSFLIANYSPELEGCLVLRDTDEFFPLLSPAMSVDLAAQAVR